ncbi:hypothetical protein BBD42_08580 [Paenibacillus sp. BIHB 4019]|uniref:Uncharacterized protein n=1 Tax=Paenibacillus sp. BIHB 4019 TaxID=1870819 RepID=A0A1B2DFL0_9BACL|nr:hypothetical protein [Paenibacillus sp. BIHB 4019]ANY66507.1 hypothetical protein BBD42_08580 [Paenibacillus sp. BIHB 4019]
MNKKRQRSSLVLVIVMAFVFVSGAAAVYFLKANHKEAPAGADAADSVRLEVKKVGPEMLVVEGANGEKVELAIGDIPLYKEYLGLQADVADIEKEVERTQVETLDIADQERFILLKYNCANKQCSTILVKESNSGLVSVGLADGIFQDYKLSPEKNRLLLRFGYNEGGQVVRHVLFAVDLVRMKVIPYERAELAKVYMFTPTWPIPDYEWVDNDQFWMASADLQSSQAGFEEVRNWFASSERKIKKMTILLNQEERLDAYSMP